MRVGLLAIMLLVLAAPVWAEEVAAPAAEAPAPTAEATPPAEVAPSETSTEETAPTRGWHVTNWKGNGRLDLQALDMREPDMSSLPGQVMAADIEQTATVTNGERDVLDLALQWPYYTQMDGVAGRGKEMHFGNAYGVYKFGLGKPNLRFGQFVVPFGNLTYYETHTRPLQSLYAQSLGIRIDRGVSLEGFKGNYDYWLALVGGNGPRHDNNHSPVLIGKLQRRYDLPSGILTTGASVLYGSKLPRFSPVVDPVMDDTEGPTMMMDGMELPVLDFVNKFRLGLDGEYSAGPTLYRAELVGGRDSDGSVNGQFLQWNLALDETREVSAQVARWDQPTGTRTRLGASFSKKLDTLTTLRLSAEQSHGRTPMENRNETMISLQYLREFPSLFGE